MAELPDQTIVVSDRDLRDALKLVWPIASAIATMEQLETITLAAGTGMVPAEVNDPNANPSKNALCLALAHSSVETASATGKIGQGRKMVWYNLAGLKCSKADQQKYDFVYTNTTEWVSEADATAILARGTGATVVQRAADAAGKVNVQLLFKGSNKSEVCSFRAFRNLPAGCLYYLGRLRTFYKSAWPFLTNASPDAYVHALKNMAYFTAGEPTYKHLVSVNYRTYLAKYDTL
jgi:hypothetical protein